MEPQPRTLVVVPTYDEAPVLAAFIEAFEHDAPGLDVLVVDDDSPDGTGVRAEQLAATRAWLHVLHRQGKDGLGVAYRDGFDWALARGYERVGQMDADLSHPPAALAALGAVLDDGADLAIGSRYVAGGGTDGWPLHRLLMSRAAALGAHLALGLPERDLSGGFKLWRADALRAIDVGSTGAQGFVFQVETTLRAHRAGLTVVEVPFTFRERVAGVSKLGAGVALEGVRTVVRLRRDPWRPARAATATPRAVPPRRPAPRERSGIERHPRAVAQPLGLLTSSLQRLGGPRGLPSTVDRERTSSRAASRAARRRGRPPRSC